MEEPVWAKGLIMVCIRIKVRWLVIHVARHAGRLRSIALRSNNPSASGDSEMIQQLFYTPVAQYRVVPRVWQQAQKGARTSRRWYQCLCTRLGSRGRTTRTLGWKLAEPARLRLQVSNEPSSSTQESSAYIL